MGRLLLEYVWIENYRCLQNIGFNFLSDEKYRFNNGILRKEKVDDVLKKGDSIFYDNFHLNAIVGNNASGKTTILNTVFSLAWGCSALQSKRSITSRIE